MKAPFATIAKNTITLDGTPIEALIQSSSLAAMLLRLNGAPWDARHATMVEAMAVGFIDHGMSPPSTINARLVASCDGDLSKALIAALACMGDTHAPITKAMEDIATWDPEEPLPSRVAGFGHPIHSQDPRVKALSDMAIDLFGKENLSQLRKAFHMEQLLPVRMNYAGVVAAICLDLRVQAPFAMLIAILGRFIGLTKHWSVQQHERQRVICFDELSQRFLE